MRLSLHKAGYRTTCAFDGIQAADLLEKTAFDLVLLDVMLPGASGFELMEYLRPMGTPVIFITAKNSLNDRVRGLRMGAEDYIVKPFEVLELLARVDVVLRRYNKTEAVLEIGGLRIDTVAMQVTRGGAPVPLTRKEYEILLLLMRNRGAALYRETIYEQVWREPWYGDTRTVDLHIQRLRKKLGLSEDIRSVYKVGYRLAAEDT